jgi:hypothetical protein
MTGLIQLALSKTRDMKCPQCRINEYVSAMVDMDEKARNAFSRADRNDSILNATYFVSYCTYSF